MADDIQTKASYITLLVMTRAIQRVVLLACVALSAVSPSCLFGQDVNVRVRLINGKNGKPITDENLNVWVNDARGSQLFRSDHDGIINLGVAGTDFLSFASNIYVTCHPYGKDEHSLRKYRVSEILDHGISDGNLCSKKIHVELTPGEFEFYERPRTFLEWWRL